MNAPSRYEFFVLADGEQKITIEEDTKIPNAATLTINKEDHTLAGMLRSQLLLSPLVKFCGYKIPHPLEPRCILKLQTDSSTTPLLAVQEASSALIRTLAEMRKQFQNEVNRTKTFQEEGEGEFGGVGGVGGGGYGGALGDTLEGQAFGTGW